MRRLLATLLAALALSNALTGQSDAADAPQTMFVIDGSGSMWGRFETDKRAKIDVIRELLKPIIQSAGQQSIGLASFGHRRKGDCSDVEIIAAPNAEHDSVITPLEKLNPRGKGPLVAGLRQAVAALAKTRPASLIVINDNADNCQQDACAAASEIASSNPGVPIHMISIIADAAEIPSLQCVAKATGGTFADVKDAVGLAAAIDAATAIAMQAPGAKPPTAPGATGAPTPVATNAPLQASVALAQGGAPIALPVVWRISKANSSEAITESAGPSIVAQLDPGNYDVEAEVAHIVIKQSVTIAAGRASSIILPLNAGRLKISARNEKAAASASTLIIAAEPVIDGKALPELTTIEHHSPATLILPAGHYNVSIADGGVHQTKAISLASGDDTAIEFTLGTGRIELSAGLREDGGAIDDVSYTISEDDPDSPDGRREVARSRAPTAAFTLPAGTYYAAARSGDGEVRQRIAVGPGDVIKRALILPLVPVKVGVLIGGQPATPSQGIVYSVTALDGERREITRSVMPELALTLIPGRYRITAQLDAHHLKAAQEITVEAGKSMNVVLKFDAGEVNLKAGGTPAAAAGMTFWEIADANGKPVWHSMAPDAKALLAPGRYTVHLETREKQIEAAFEIRSGERKVVLVGQN